MGFIGSAVSNELKMRGHDVVSIDRAHGRNIFDPRLKNWLKDTDTLIHLAGVLGTEELFDNAEVAVQINVGGTVRVLQACAASGVRFLGITMPDVWANVYQATKRCARDMATAWHINFELPVAHVLAYNVFGVGQKVHGVQKIVPTFAHRAWRGQPIPIWGSGYQPVDLVPVEEVARVYADQVENGEFKDEIVHAGSGFPMTVLEVAERVMEITDSRAIEHHPMRKGEQERIAVSPTMMSMSIDEWEIAFRKTVNWYKKERP